MYSNVKSTVTNMLETHKSNCVLIWKTASNPTQGHRLKIGDEHNSSSF